MPGLIGCQLRVGLVLVVAVKTVVVSTCTVPRLYITEEIMAPLVWSEYMYFILASLTRGWQTQLFNGFISLQQLHRVLIL